MFFRVIFELQFIWITCGRQKEAMKLGFINNHIVQIEFPGADIELWRLFMRYFEIVLPDDVIK